jgi:hypothetical protein
VRFAGRAIPIHASLSPANSSFRLLYDEKAGKNRPLWMIEAFVRVVAFLEEPESFS